MADPQAAPQPTEMLTTRPPGDTLAEICGQIAGAFRRQWGRGPVKTTARWAGPNLLVVLLENGHTEAEKTMRAAGHIQQLLDGRRLLQSTLTDELQAIVQTATGRSVTTMLSATRLDPDLSAEIFLLAESHPAGSADSLKRAVNEATQRAQELGDEAKATQAQARHVTGRVDRRRGETDT